MKELLLIRFLRRPLRGRSKAKGKPEAGMRRRKPHLRKPDEGSIADWFGKDSSFGQWLRGEDYSRQRRVGNEEE